MYITYTLCKHTYLHIYEIVKGVNVLLYQAFNLKMS